MKGSAVQERKRPPPFRGFRVQVPPLFPEAGYSDSVVDSIVRRASKNKHNSAVLDDFEDFLQSRDPKAREVYHQIAQKPASIFGVCLWSIAYKPNESKGYARF